jgi:hypothetical protein
MTTVGTRSHGPVESPDNRAEPDDYSPAFAAWALLLTLVVLAAIVAAAWGLRGL